MKFPFLILLLTLILIPRAPAQVFVAGPIEESIHSGIATNNWAATTNGTVLRSVLLNNQSGADVWCFIFDSSTTNIVNGTSTNLAAFKVTSGPIFYYDPPNGEACRKGIVIMQSTTWPTLTNATAATAALVVTVKHRRN